MSAKSRGGSVSALNRLIFLAILIPLAVIAVSYFMSPSSPFHTQASPSPVLVGQIKKQYKMETAEVPGSTIVEGKTGSILPFSEEKIVYQVVVTMTAGIDMSTLSDSDISVSGETVTVKLPAPQVLRTERVGKVISQNSEILAGFSKNKNLQDQVEDEGQKKVVKTILEQGELMQKARLNAEDNLRQLFLQLGYKNVVFIQAEPQGTPSPGPSLPPR